MNLKMKKESLEGMTISKPIYFLMLVCLVAGLVLMFATHFVLSINDLDLNMMSDLNVGDAVESLLVGEGDLVEELARIAEFAEAHTRDGDIHFSTLDVFTLAQLGFVKVILVLVYAAAIAVALIPMFTGRKWSVCYLIPANIAPVASMAALVGVCAKLTNILAPAERTLSLIAWVTVSVMSMVFAFCLIINMLTSEAKAN